MKRSATILALAATVSLGATSVVHAGETEEPTYQEFKTQTLQDEDRQYIVNGDIPVSGERQLRDFYQGLVEPSHEANLVVNTVYGKDDVWSVSQAKNLTYCVSTKFGSDHARVRDAMASGAAQWEAASSGVDFTYVAAQDGKCTTRNNNVLFSVEPTRTTSYIARAFFPSTPKRQRNVLVSTSQLFNAGSWTPEQHHGPRARPHPGLPPRAHPARGGHLLRGQQLASADSLRLVVDHALPAVQRDER